MGCARKKPRRLWDRASFSIWLPAVTMMMVSTLSYIDRNTLALLAPSILRDLHISNQEYGYVISGFSIAYMLFNPLGPHRGPAWE